MYIRLAFAVAVHAEPEILLVDEVLSVGDAFFQEKCIERMHQFQREGTTIVVVSHATQLLSEFCQRVIWMDHGHVIADGPAAEIVRQYAATVPHHQEAAV